jgi:hypothetical protein
MEIKTKFSVGDEVYYASTKSVQKQRSCPDCLDQKKWSVTSPGGGQYTFACPRCSAGYSSRRNDLVYLEVEPEVTKVTITNLEYRHKDHYNGAEQTQYWMSSGYIVYDPSKNEDNAIFRTEEEAKLRASALALARCATDRQVVESQRLSLEISDYQLTVIGYEDEKRKERALIDRASKLNWAIADAVRYVSAEDDAAEPNVPDKYDLEWAVRDLRKGLSAYLGEVIGGVDARDGEAT